MYALAFYQTYGIAEDFLDPANEFKGDAYHWTAFHALPYVARSQVKDGKWKNSDEGLSEAQRTLVSITDYVGRHEDWNNPDNPWEPTKIEIVVGHLLRTVPKLKLVPVDPISQESYAHSVLLAVSTFTHILKIGTLPSSVAKDMPHSFIPNYQGDAPLDSAHPLANVNLDTGFVEPHFAYHLTDTAYFKVLQYLAQHPDYPVPIGIQTDVLAYFDEAHNHLKL